MYYHRLSPRLLLKLPHWFPYLYSYSVKVHSHTAAKIIFICLKSLPLCYWKYPTTSDLNPSFSLCSIGPCMGWVLPTSLTSSHTFSPFSLAFLCMEQAELLLWSSHWHFYSLHQDLAHLTHSLLILPISDLTSPPQRHFLWSFNL